MGGMSQADLIVSPKPTEALYTELDADGHVRNSMLSPKVLSEKPKPKKVKDGVDILGLDAKKPIQDCESSLELILVTLSSAFQMNPKQAAALLTNNNQYLITACIKGVKGGKYEPLLSWYEQLIINCGTLAELLTLELEQLPETSRQTFVKVMAAIGCGFYSYHSELVLMTIELFKSLFTRIRDQSDVHAQALKWFLAQAPAQEVAASEETTAEQLIGEDKTQQQQQTAGLNQPQQQLDMINAGGLRLSLYALGKHREATRPAMELYEALCENETQVYTLYTAEVQKHTKSVLEYMELVGEFLPIMSELWPTKAIESGLVDFWLDLASREAENDFKAQNREKVLAIALLTEIWLLFTDYVDDKEAVTNTLIFVFKRTVSERTKTIRLLSIAYLFKVLEKLIALKKKAALTLYRTLIFSLVESPYDPTIRELYLANFAELYCQNPKMPVEWLVEPLLKQLQAQLGTTFVLKVFDFTFMLSLLEHSKFKEEHASQMFALFATVSLQDVSYATASHEVMLATLTRFLSSSHQSSELLSKAQEHIRFAFSELLELEPISKAAAQAQMKRQQRQNALKARQGMSIGGAGRSSQLQLQAAVGTGGSTPNSTKPPLKAKDLLLSKQVGHGSLTGTSKANYQKDMQRRLKKSLLITFLLKAQALNISELNLAFLKNLLFEKTKEFKATYGYFNKGHLELLKGYGDPETLIVDNELEPPKVGDSNQTTNNGQQLQARHASIGAKSTPYTNKQQTSSKVRHLTPASQRDAPAEGGGVVAIYNEKDQHMDNSRQVVPFGTNDGQAVRGRSIGGRARAMQEIEKIKKQKKDRELKKEAEQDKLRQQSAQRKRKARQQVEKRKQALGVADKAPSKLPALMYGSVTVANENSEKPGGKTKQVQYVKIEDEEDRDRDTVLEFMRKYQKLWRNVFAKYQNTAHKTNVSRQLASFDASKSQVLNFAEIMRLLKDHGVYPQMINKDELSQTVRLVNQKADEPRTDVGTLTFGGYQTFLIQLAVHIFSKPPQDLSSQPMVKSLEALVTKFLEATKKRNLSTLLYEDPDAVVAMTPKEKDMLKNLNEQVKEQPDYPMPEGYLKVKEKVPITEYRVPECATDILGESKVVCVELVDELVSKLFDFHFLEPMVTMQEQYRVKPSMQRSLQKPRNERSDRAEALSIIRRAEEKRGSFESSDLVRNKVSLPKLPTKQKTGNVTLDQLPSLYSKLVKKQPKKKQPVYIESAFVLENVIRKVCGQSALQLNQDLAGSDARSASSMIDSREAGSLSSHKLGGIAGRSVGALDDESLGGDGDGDIDAVKFDQVRRQQEKMTLMERRQKERKRQERQKKLKEDLARLKAEKEVKDAEDAQKRKDDAKRKKEAEKRTAERLQKQRTERIQEIVAKKEEKEAKNTEELEANAEEEREKEREKQREKREFFKKQQEKLNNQFKSMTDQRKANSLNEQQKAALEKKKKEQLKQKIDYKPGKGHRERQLAAEIAAFLQKPGVSSLFNDHEKSLLKYFKFYCRQNRVELGHDLQYRLEHCDFGAFNKLGLQSKIVPVLLTSEQLKLTFRNTIKYQLNNIDLQDVAPKAEENKSVAEKPTPVLNDQATQMDFDQFKQALVRVAIQGQELLGGQSDEQKQRKAQLDEKRRQAEQRKKDMLKNRQEQRARLESETLQEMRSEFAQKQKQIQTAMSRSPAKRLDKVQSDSELIKTDDAASVSFSEEDFQRWLKQQDNIGNGLNNRVAEKLNNASKPKQASTADGSAGQEIPAPVQESPAKLINQPDVAESSEQVDTAPLLRAKQSQAQRASQQDGPADAELDIAFISENTVKALFEFMKVEAGDEGERSVDQVLAAQSSYQGRSRGAAGATTGVKRGISKEPVAAQATPAVAAQDQ